MVASTRAFKDALELDALRCALGSFIAPGGSGLMIVNKLYAEPSRWRPPGGDRASSSRLAHPGLPFQGPGVRGPYRYSRRALGLGAKPPVSLRVSETGRKTDRVRYEMSYDGRCSDAEVRALSIKKYGGRERPKLPFA